MKMIVCQDANDIDVDGFDTLIVDPPYSQYVHKNMHSVSTKQARARQGKGVEQRDVGFDPLSGDLRSVIARAIKTVTRWSLVYSDYELGHEWIATSPEQYVRGVAWVRWSQPQLSGDRPPQGFEVLNVFHAKGRKRWNGPGSLVDLNGVRHTCLRGKHKHPTEKPLDQLLDLVSWFSDPGEHVLDMCCGSGTTAVACALLGRECLGVDNDPQWAEYASEREEAALAGQVLDRDMDRILLWAKRTRDDAERTDPNFEPAMRRAQQRLEDVETCLAAVK